MKLAILDDYQGVALEAADWSSIAPAVAISVFDAHLGDSDAVVRALGEFDIIVAMRERTPFPQYVLERLPMKQLDNSPVLVWANRLVSVLAEIL